MERYSVWIRINNSLMGPSLVISLAYILFFLGLTSLFWIKPELAKNYLTYYYIGFPFFIISIWIAFTGGLLKGIKNRD